MGLGRFLCHSSDCHTGNEWARVHTHRPASLAAKHDDACCTSRLLPMLGTLAMAPAVATAAGV